MRQIVGRAKREILSELRRHPSYGYALSQKLDLPITGIYAHLRELRENGLVSTQEQGRRTMYRLTAKGTKLLEFVGTK